MKTILTKKEQSAYLESNWHNNSIIHAWSTRGMGSSRILNGADKVIGKAGGCGYDRRGAALGETIANLFPDAVITLAKRTCNGKRADYKESEQFYGIFYDAKRKKAWLDGGCGFNCMVKILNKIGFSLVFCGETKTSSNSGKEFFRLEPLSKNDRKRLQ